MQDTGPSKDKVALAELFRLYASTLNAGDIDAWATLWDEDGVQMPPDGFPVEGKAQILEANRSLVTELSTAMDPIVIEESTIVGDLAYTRARYTATFTPRNGGSATFVDGKALTIFRRSADGAWKIYCDCFNSNVPPSERS